MMILLVRGSSIAVLVTFEVAITTSNFLADLLHIGMNRSLDTILEIIGVVVKEIMVAAVIFSVIRPGPSKPIMVYRQNIKLIYSTNRSVWMTIG